MYRLSRPSAGNWTLNDNSSSAVQLVLGRQQLPPRYSIDSLLAVTSSSRDYVTVAMTTTWSHPQMTSYATSPLSTSTPEAAGAASRCYGGSVIDSIYLSLYIYRWPILIERPYVSSYLSWPHFVWTDCNVIASSRHGQLHGPAPRSDPVRRGCDTLSSDKTRKLSSIEDRGPTDRVSNWNLNVTLTLTFSPRRTMTHAHAKWSLGSTVRVEQTDGRTEATRDYLQCYNAVEVRSGEVRCFTSQMQTPLEPTLCTSGFVGAVMFSHNGPYGASCVFLSSVRIA